MQMITKEFTSKYYTEISTSLTEIMKSMEKNFKKIFFGDYKYNTKKD